MKANNSQQKSTPQPFKPKPLTVEQERALTAILTGKNDCETAALVGCSRWTVQGWRTHHPLFQATLAQRREEVFSGVVDRLRTLLHKAVGNISEAIASGDVKASFEVLKATGVHGFMPPTGELDVQKLFDELVRRELDQARLPDKVDFLIDPLRNHEKDRRREAIEADLLAEFGEEPT